jgi:hypothetical protein
MYGGFSYGSASYAGKPNWFPSVEKLFSAAMDIWGYVNKKAGFPIQLGIITLSKIKAVLKITKERVRTKYKFL